MVLVPTFPDQAEPQMIRPLILTLAVVGFVACKNQEKTADTADGGAPAQAASAEGIAHDGAVQLGGSNAADSLVLSIERTACFGTCKSYRIDVYRSGFAEYVGRAHVELIGRGQGRVDQAVIERLVARAESIGFARMDPVYDSPVTDLPATTIRVAANGTDHTVMGRVGAPDQFRSLANQMEEELLALPWRPVPDQD